MSVAPISSTPQYSVSESQVSSEKKAENMEVEEIDNYVPTQEEIQAYISYMLAHPQQPWRG